MLNEKDEELVPKCIVIMREEKRASTTLFQSRLRIGYARASRLFEALVERGCIIETDGQYHVAEAGPQPVYDGQPRIPDFVNPPLAAAPEPELAPASAPAPAPAQSVTITPMAKPENPIDRITDVVLYRGAEGFMSFVIGKGIVVRGQLTFEEWREAHYGMFKFREYANMGLADSVNYARKMFGDTLVDEALQQMEFPFIEAKKAAALENVPWAAREYKLEEEHFFAAGSAQLEPEDTAKWLEIAVEEKLSPIELKRSIEIGKVMHTEQTQAGKGKNSGYVTISAVRCMYLQWKRNHYQGLLDATPEMQQQVLQELEPICELIDKLRANIAAREAK